MPTLDRRSRRGRPPEPHLALDRPHYAYHLARLDVDQAALARAVGVDPVHLSAVVTGRRPLTVRLARLLAGAMGVGVSEITSTVDR